MVAGEPVCHRRVLSGRVTIQLREGELFVVRGRVEHCPTADDEAHVLLIELAGTTDTGDVGGELTAEEREI
jgi:hypothetical protein